MTATTTNISKNEFDDYEPSRRLFVHEHARRFARLELPDSQHTVAISWRSHTIEPSVVVDTISNTTWVGIDDRLASVANDGQILFSLGLTSQLLTLELREGKAVAICELQAIVVRDNGSINTIIEFPDVVDDFSITDDHLSASFMDGGTAEFSI